MHQEALLKACLIMGGQSALAKKLNVKHCRVNRWLNRDKAIPYHYAIAIEHATQGQVSRHALAPNNNPARPFASEILDRLAGLENKVVALEQSLKAAGPDKKPITGA